MSCIGHSLKLLMWEVRERKREWERKEEKTFDVKH